MPPRGCTLSPSVAWRRPRGLGRSPALYPTWGQLWSPDSDAKPSRLAPRRMASLELAKRRPHCSRRALVHCGCGHRWARGGRRAEAGRGEPAEALAEAAAPCPPAPSPAADGRREPCCASSLAVSRQPETTPPSPATPRPRVGVSCGVWALVATGLGVTRRKRRLAQCRGCHECASVRARGRLSRTPTGSHRREPSVPACRARGGESSQEDVAAKGSCWPQATDGARCFPVTQGQRVPRETRPRSSRHGPRPARSGREGRGPARRASSVSTRTDRRGPGCKRTNRFHTPIKR